MGLSLADFIDCMHMAIQKHNKNDYNKSTFNAISLKKEYQIEPILAIFIQFIYLKWKLGAIWINYN